MQSVTAVITYLGWFIAGFDLERPVHTSVRNFGLNRHRESGLFSGFIV